MSSSSTPAQRSRLAEPQPLRPLSGELTLRFGETRLSGRVTWPDGASRRDPSPLILLLSEVGVCGAPGPLGESLCVATAAVVLHFPLPGADGAGERAAAGYAAAGLAVAALGWAAEHAAELAASQHALSVAGLSAGAARATWLAACARDVGWPPVTRQLLVHPSFGPASPIPREAAGLAPATIVTDPAPDADGRRYAARLRAAAVDVVELHGPRPASGAAWAQAIRTLGLTYPAASAPAAAVNQSSKQRSHT